jgi:hypothetical protein
MLTTLLGSFGRRLRSLDEAPFRKFVAEFWRASGWDVSVWGEQVVVARPGVNDCRVLVVRGSRLRPFVSPEPIGDADVLVTGLGGRGQRRSASRVDASVVGAVELRQRALYAIDAENRDRLLRTHLGLPPDIVENGDRFRQWLTNRRVFTDTQSHGSPLSR